MLKKHMLSHLALEALEASEKAEESTVEIDTEEPEEEARAPQEEGAEEEAGDPDEETDGGQEGEEPDESDEAEVGEGEDKPSDNPIADEVRQEPIPIPDTEYMNVDQVGEQLQAQDEVKELTRAQEGRAWTRIIL